MRLACIVLVLVTAGPVHAGPVSPAVPPVSLAELLPGTYANEEQVYFAKETGHADAGPWIGLRITVGGGLVTTQRIDGFGQAVGPAKVESLAGNTVRQADCTVNFTPDGAGYVAAAGTAPGCKSPDQPKSLRVDAAGLTLTHADGRVVVLRRARTATCWGTVPKTALKPDGSQDWVFVGGLKLFDQGGRARFGGGDSGAPPVVIRMRNVVWPSGPNKPSLVLYVHKPENPDHAESYGWADPDAKRIGINLRWMQASCSIDAP